MSRNFPGRTRIQQSRGRLTARSPGVCTSETLRVLSESLLCALTFQREAGARVVLPRTGSHHPGDRARQRRHSCARRRRIQSRLEKPYYGVSSLQPCCDPPLRSSPLLPRPPPPLPPPFCTPLPGLQTRPFQKLGRGGEVVGGWEEGGDKEVQTNKYSNPQVRLGPPGRARS